MIPTQVTYDLQLSPQNSTDKVRKALIELKNKNARQIILDLRSNPGGLLTEAVDIVNLFVGTGNEIVSTKRKSKTVR